MTLKREVCQGACCFFLNWVVFFFLNWVVFFFLNWVFFFFLNWVGFFYFLSFSPSPPPCCMWGSAGPSVGCCQERGAGPTWQLPAAAVCRQHDGSVSPPCGSEVR